jgi:hypothetical protein
MGYGTKKFIYFSYLSCNELKEYAYDLSHSALAQVPLLPKREKNLWHKTLIEEKTWLGSLQIEVFEDNSKCFVILSTHKSMICNSITL